MNQSLDALRQAHQELRNAVPGKRRQARNDDGDLHALGKETFRIWDRMRDNGESFQDRCAYLAGVLKHILRFGRVWKYLCQQCDDYGLVISECPGDRTCGRFKPHLAHSYGTPCVCGNGNAFRAPEPASSDYTAAGKTAKPKPRGWTRMGR